MRTERCLEMNQRIPSIGLGILLLITGSACSPQSPIRNDSVTAVAARAQETQILIKPASTATDTRLPVTPAVPSIEQNAPPYEEIKQTVDRIVGRNENRGGPEVGPDGIIDPMVKGAFGNYNIQLRGKRANNWQGWLGSFNESDPGNSSKGYNLGIFMREPKPGEEANDGVLLLKVSQDQVEAFKLGISLAEGFGTIHSSWPRVVFTGTIAGVFHNGRVLLDDVTVKFEE
jgi:hypothetical protein